MIMICYTYKWILTYTLALLSYNHMHCTSSNYAIEISAYNGNSEYDLLLVFTQDIAI